jgi:alpha-N-arabinofuranosidase
MPGLSGSASIRDKELTVTITNPSLDSPVTAQIRFTNRNLTEGQGSLLTNSEMTAGNSLDHPDIVRSVAFPVSVAGKGARISIPPRAVVSLQLRIA